jgi:hypothetical protein
VCVRSRSEVFAPKRLHTRGVTASLGQSSLWPQAQRIGERLWQQRLTAVKKTLGRREGGFTQGKKLKDLKKIEGSCGSNTSRLDADGEFVAFGPPLTHGCVHVSESPAARGHRELFVRQRLHPALPSITGVGLIATMIAGC